MGGGRLVLIVGGRWEVSPNSWWEVGSEVCGRWTLNIGGRLAPKTGGRWEVEATLLYIMLLLVDILLY